MLFCFIIDVSAIQVDLGTCIAGSNLNAVGGGNSVIVLGQSFRSNIIKCIIFLFICGLFYSFNNSTNLLNIIIYVISSMFISVSIIIRSSGALLFLFPVSLAGSILIAYYVDDVLNDKNKKNKSLFTPQIWHLNAVNTLLLYYLNT